MTDAVLVVGPGGYQPGGAHRVDFAAVAPVRLAGSSRLSLSFEHFYRIVPAPDDPRRWIAQTSGYAYAFDDVHGREVLAYHWHPAVPMLPFLTFTLAMAR